MNRQRRDLHGIDIGIWPDVDLMPSPMHGASFFPKDGEQLSCMPKEKPYA